MKSFSIWKKRFRLGTASTLIATLGIVGAIEASAQEVETDDEDKEEVEEVVVTGSRIRRNPDAQSLPTTVTTAIEIENRGFTNVIEALNDNPIFVGNTTSAGANNQLGDNFAFANILGLGTNRTLTLLNGRRFVGSNQATVFVPNNETGAQVDLSIINPALLERQETIIASGGAIYGADAVAGVVNLQTKDDYEGLNITVQGGLSSRGDGEEYQVRSAYGQNFHNGRGNFAISVDYFNQDNIQGSERGFLRQQRFEINNPLNGFVRNPAFPSAGQAFATISNGLSVPGGFLAAGADGLASTIDILNGTQRDRTLGGLLIADGNFSGGFAATGDFVPQGFVAGGLAGAAADPQGFAFFAPSSLPAGVDPLAVISSFGQNGSALSAAQQNQLALTLLQGSRPTVSEFFNNNPGINPLLFVGTFGDVDLFPRIPNPDASTANLFPFLAVPLQFDPSGNLVPFNVGSIDPSNTQASIGIGGDGTQLFGAETNVRSSTERTSFFGTANYDLTDNLNIYTELLYSHLEFDSVGLAPTNTPNGGFGGTSRSIPIYINENPFLNDQARGVISDLQAQGLTLPQLNGQDVLFLSRTLQDVIGGVDDSTNESETFRATLGLEGDFEFLNRNFYWDTSFVYGRNEVTNSSEDILDIEFALATDIVTDPDTGQAVCRQQTLDAPESIAVRNPVFQFANNTTGLVPTQAQVDACVPLNLFGEGAPSPEAIAFVLGNNGSRNVSEQIFYQAALGADVFDLPAGTVLAATQFEYRREELSFEPNDVFGQGLARATAGDPTQGELEFYEVGAELLIPVFGGDFTLPGFHSLEFEGAWRLVNRDQDSSNEAFADILSTLGSVTDHVFTVQGRWRPIPDLQLRGQYSESVRSASVVELFGASQTGFSNADLSNVCTATAVNQGPNPAVRRTNCIQAATLLGIDDPENFIDNFQNITGGGNPPAATGGNPALSNEQSESYSFGFLYEPSWIDGLYLTADYVAVDLSSQIDLVGPAVNIAACFDQAEFPNSSINGTNVCDQFVLGVDDGTGTFVVPSTNPLTGNPLPVEAVPGEQLGRQGPFQIGFAQFPNLNLATTELRQINLGAGYNFALENLFGARASDWGRIAVRANWTYLDRFDIFSDGTPDTLNQNAGEAATPQWNGRVDLDYSVGRFGFLAQWFYTDGSVTNVQTDVEDFPEQQNDFVIPEFHRFNASFRYQIADNVTARFIVNNVFDNNGEFGPAGDPFFIQRDAIGRFFRFSLSADF